jgi:hypothetical protein
MFAFWQLIGSQLKSIGSQIVLIIKKYTQKEWFLQYFNVNLLRHSFTI